MKIIYSAIIIAVLSVTSYAADYGVVDFEYILSKAKAQKSAAEQIQKYEADLRSSFQKESETLQKMQADLQTNKDKLSEKQLEAKNRDFSTKVADFQKRGQEKQQALQQSAEEASQAIQKSLQEVIEKLAKAKKLDNVMIAGALAYYNKDFDISDEVLKELDKALPKVTVKKP